jgi:organic radical activating enzyme
MCCKTNGWEPMVLGEDWFNSNSLQERRLAHLTGVKHKDCDHCWSVETKNLESFRDPMLGAIKPIGTTTQKTYKKSYIEIKVSNTCNMSCRYCGPTFSSIWAERLNDDIHNKSAVTISKNSIDRKNLIQQFYNWLDNEIDNVEALIFTGGEVSITPQFYDIIEELNFKNVNIHINSSLNIPENYMQKFEKVLHKLSINNKVYVRASLDCTEKQFEWQRQGGNWNLIKNNYFRLGKIPIHLVIGQTITMFSLEGLPTLGKFIANSKDSFINYPKFSNTAHLVIWPHAFDPTEWIPSYKDDIIKFLEIGNANDIIQHGLNKQLLSWIDRQYTLPKLETVQTMCNWLDNVQNKWGAVGDWREIYPKTNSIVNKVLTQT